MGKLRTTGKSQGQDLGPKIRNQDPEVVMVNTVFRDTVVNAESIIKKLNTEAALENRTSRNYSLRPILR